jgi:hypothetical protein
LQLLWAADAPVAKASAAQKLDPEQAAAQFRADLRATRADVMAKPLMSRAEHASKFWPLHERYQKGQNAIIDAQPRATKKSADKVSTLCDADALVCLKVLLERDDQMQVVHVRWFAVLRSVSPAGFAARAIHVYRRLGLVAQLELASQHSRSFARPMDAKRDRCHCEMMLLTNDRFRADPGSHARQLRRFDVLPLIGTTPGSSLLFDGNRWHRTLPG